jgi:hypothetical protein
MESFFVPIPLTPARQKAFTKMGVPATEFVLEHKENSSAEAVQFQGFIIQGVDNKNKVLGVLKASELEIRNTQYEGIYLVKCQTAKETPKPKKTKSKAKKVKVEAKPIMKSPDLPWDGQNEPGFLKIVEDVLYPIVKKDIIVHPHHNHRCLPINDGKFHIHLWSGSIAKGTVEDSEMPTELFSTKLQCRDWAGWGPGENEAALEDQSSGWAFASFIRDNLYIHFDCFHYGDERELNVFQNILQMASKYAVIDMDPERDLVKFIKDEKRAIRLKRFVDLCNNRRQDKIKDLRRKVEDRDKRIVQLREEMLKELTRRKEIDSELLFLETTPLDDTEILSRELDRLDSLDKIVKLDILKNKICIYTSLLLSKDSRTKKIHEIGEFRIEIDPTGSSGSGGVRFYNLTRKVNASSSRMNAPHVYNDGHACLGNAESSIVEMVRRRQIVELIQYLIAFLETANTEDSAGAHINKWPEVTKKTRTMLEKKYGKKLEEIYV